jgi:hypothetical protein
MGVIMQGHNELNRQNYVKNLVKPDNKFSKYGDKNDGFLQGQVSVSYSKTIPNKEKFWMDKIPGGRFFVYMKEEIKLYDVATYSPELIAIHYKRNNNLSLNSSNSSELSPLKMSCNEVISGEFALLVLGKGDAPVTALKVTNLGSDNPCRVISRMKYPDCADLYDFFTVENGKDRNGKCQYKIAENSIINKKLKNHPLTGFGENLALKILMQDRDIKIDSFVTYHSRNRRDVVYSSTGKNNIYGIDWEQSFIARQPDVFDILKSPQKMVHIIDEIKKAPDPWAEIAQMLERQIDIDAVGNLIKQIGKMPEEHIQAIGTRLKEQLTKNGVNITDNGTKEFIDSRIEKLLDIKKSCQKYCGVDVAEAGRPTLAQRIGNQTLTRI